MRGGCGIVERGELSRTFEDAFIQRASLVSVMQGASRFV